MKPPRLCLGIIIVSFGAMLLVSCSPRMVTDISIAGTNGVYNEPQWSPDGQRIIVSVVGRGVGFERLVEINLHTNIDTTIPLFFENLLLNYPHPIYVSNTHILYDHRHSSLDDPENASRFVLYNTLTGLSEVIYTGTNIGLFDWCPTTNQIVAILSSERIGRYQEIVLITIGSSEITKIAQLPENEWAIGVACSSNGQNIAITTTYETEDNDRRHRIFVIDAVTGETVGLDIDSTDESYTSPTWSPDGVWIATRVTSAAYGQSIRIYAASGDISTDIQTPFAPVYLDWSPSANVLVATSLGVPGRNRLYLVDISEYIPEVENVD